MLADNRMLQLILRNSHIYHTIAELFMMLITIPLFLYLGKMPSHPALRSPAP